MCAGQVTRLSTAGLKGLVGQEAFERLQAKNLGGANNYKGTRYEQLFGAHRIAQLARVLLEEGEDPVVEWQSDAFVDDLVVRRDEQRSIEGYQLKNAAAVSWTAGKNPIAQDFFLQHTVSTAEGYEEIRLGLVSSDKTLVHGLSETVPDTISGYSSARFFPACEPILPALVEHEWLAEDFGFLSKHEQPSGIDVEQVTGVLVGAWSMRAPIATVSEVLKQARHMSPTIIRALKSDREAEACLSDELRQVLNSLPDFNYSIVRGFLRWSAFGGSTSGVLSFDCFDGRFASWQQYIVDSKPAAFEDVEGVFI